MGDQLRAPPSLKTLSTKNHGTITTEGFKGGLSNIGPSLRRHIRRPKLQKFQFGLAVRDTGKISSAVREADTSRHNRVTIQASQ